MALAGCDLAVADEQRSDGIDVVGGVDDAASRQLRRVEGILRRWSYEGETVLPDDPAPYYRVSVRCGYESPEAFRAAMAKCRTAVREVYLKVFRF